MELRGRVLGGTLDLQYGKECCEDLWTMGKSGGRNSLNEGEECC
jgi:hypothetical protein